MYFHSKKILLVITVFMFGIAPQSFAAGSGAFHIFASDAEAAGKGFAFVGEADNPSAVFYNPAGLVQLKKGSHISAGSAVIWPYAEHTSAAGAETQMRQGTFPVPHVYAVSDFGTENFAFGLGSTSNWGLTIDWGKDNFSRYVATKTELTNLDNMLTMAYRVSRSLSVGVGVIYDLSKITKQKAILQAAGNDGQAELQGDDDGIAYTVSTLYKLNDRHQFGLVYRSEMDFTYEGNATADNLTNDGATAYRTIFGGASYSTAFTADLTLPQSIAFGYSYTPNEKWRFNIDAQWMDWSSIESERVSFPEETDETRLTILDVLTYSDRDWAGTFSYSAGTEYSLSDRFRLRGGYFYIPTPIPEETFDTTVPVGNGHGLNFGFGYDFENLTLDMAWTGIKYENWNIDNTQGAALGGDVDGKYENFVSIATATLTYDF